MKMTHSQITMNGLMLAAIEQLNEDVNSFFYQFDQRDMSTDQRHVIKLGAIKKEIMLSIKGLRKIREACERGDVEVYDPSKID